MQVEMLNSAGRPDLGWRIVQHIPYRLWKFINLLEWTLLSPVMSHLFRDYSWCPFGCKTGYMIWKVIHE